MTSVICIIEQNYYIVQGTFKRQNGLNFNQEFIYYLTIIEISLNSNLIYHYYSDCAESVRLQNITDNNVSISCRLHQSCMKVDCCFYLDDISASFTTYFELDQCALVFHIGFEKLIYSIAIKEAVDGKT